MDYISSTSNNKYDLIQIYITGYGAFMNIKYNPSQNLCEKFIEDQINYSQVFDEKCKIKYYRIFDVDVDHVKENVNECHKLIEEEIEKNGIKTMYLIIHCGVNAGANKVNLERISKNYINDYCKYNCKINEEDPEIYECKLDLNKLSNELNKRGNNCEISEDAGKYLCNYLYFLSNKKFIKHPNVYSLFYHIPSLETMCLNDSHKCLLDLIDEVKKNYLNNL